MSVQVTMANEFYEFIFSYSSSKKSLCKYKIIDFLYMLGSPIIKENVSSAAFYVASGV